MTLDVAPLYISVESLPNGTTLTVRGEVDIATAKQLRDAVLRHLAAARSLSLDLEGVAFMDSSGLHALIECQRRAALLGHSLIIARAAPAVDRLLQVTGTTTLFERATSPEDATVTPQDMPTDCS
jgi:anti-anti-sigma factor